MDTEEKLRVQIDFVSAIKKAMNVYFERGGSVSGAIAVLKSIIKDNK